MPTFSLRICLKLLKLTTFQSLIPRSELIKSALLPDNGCPHVFESSGLLLTVMFQIHKGSLLVTKHGPCHCTESFLRSLQLPCLEGIPRIWMKRPWQKRLHFPQVFGGHWETHCCGHTKIPKINRWVLLFSTSVPHLVSIFYGSIMSAFLVPTTTAPSGSSKFHLENQKLLIPNNFCIPLFVPLYQPLLCMLYTI